MHTQSNFNGRHFLVGCNPWSHHLLGYEIPEEEGGWAGNKFRDGAVTEYRLFKSVS